MTHVPYDEIAEIYDIWIDNFDPVLEENKAYYLAEYLAADGPVVELGVGNGRILTAAAVKGKTVIGVDYSARMLDLCRRHAEEAGVSERVHLIQSDFRDFTLPEPAALIAIPYDSLGHLTSPDAKRACIEHIYSQLAPGGRFLLDVAVFDQEAAQRTDRMARLVFTYTDPATGQNAMLWNVRVQDTPNRSWRTYVWRELVAEEGTMHRKMIGSVENSWIAPEELEEMLENAGFRVTASYGGFNRTPPNADSRYRILTAERK